MAKRTKKLRGTGVMPAEPNWDPLERAVIHWLAGSFMAMHEVELKNGVRLCCYKHIDTRRSLHLDEDLNAYLHSFDERKLDEPGYYEQVSLREAFDLVVLQPEFELGWIERGRSDRLVYDEEGNEVRGDEPYTVTRFEQRLAGERWEALRAPLAEAEA